MKNIIALSFLWLFLVATAFAGPPEVKKVNISKTELKPGDEIQMTIEFTEPDVASVELLSREYYYDAPPMKLQQTDNKNVWAFMTNVPYDAPAGTHHLEIKAMDQDGNEIVGEQCEGCQYGKTGVVQIKIN
ncbi:MAG: hypothetical protein ACNS62_24970 [Candidatus Cyclobacteriaceae bacterium M3_2C_046]